MRTHKKNQTFTTILPQLVPDIASNVIGSIEQMRPRVRKILNAMLYHDGATGKIYMRQDTLGKYSKCTREWVNKIIKRFEEQGWITSNYRHLTSCEYKVNELFHDFSIRNKLRALLPALAFFPIAWIDPLIKEKFTQYYSSYIYNSTNSNSSKFLDQDQVTSRNTRARAREFGDQKTDGWGMVAEYVQNIEGVVLTIEDKVNLSRYSEGAVLYALGCLKKKDGIKIPIAYLIACCKGYEANLRGGMPIYKRNQSPNVSPVLRVKKEEPRKEIREDAFWKNDMEKMAHWDVVEVGDFIQKNNAFGIAQAFAERVRLAHTNHESSTCHLCIQYGSDYKQPMPKPKDKKPIPTPFQDSLSMLQAPTAIASDLPVLPPQLRTTPPKPVAPNSFGEQISIIFDRLQPTPAVVKKDDLGYTTEVMQQEYPLEDYGDSDIYEEVYDEPGQLDLYN